VESARPAFGMADDDWETDADHVNDLTEAEQRAYGNRETMLKYVCGARSYTGSLQCPWLPRRPMPPLPF
jgi:hypothetical protein